MSHGIELLTTPEYRAKLDQCIHCGMCLQACPTYSVFGTEMDSPRGRIALMRAAADGRIGPHELTTTFATHIDRCLLCRACETACPSSVQYGALAEEARVVIAQQHKPAWLERAVRWAGLRQLMPHTGRLKLMARFFWLYEASGLQRLLRKVDKLPQTLKAMEALLPPITPRYRAYHKPAPSFGRRQGRVAFFHGCIQEAFLSACNEASIRVLQRNGYEVIFPREQTCCGAAHSHVADEDYARALARRNIDAFLSLDVDAIIVNAGGCGMALKDYPHLLRNDARYADLARALAAKVQDINEFLADHLHVPSRGELRLKATYVDSCHLRHGQKVVKQPRMLLRTIPGLELVELKQPDRCCGSAGVYNITHVETANAVLDDKMADVAGTGANLVVVSNTGCYLQLLAGVRRAGIKADVKHVVEVLDRAYQAERR